MISNQPIITVGRVFSSISRTALIIFVFLLPLFFLPITTEWFEWNKQYLLYAVVIVSTFCWIFKALAERTITFKRTPLDIPLLLLVLAMLASSIFSKDRITSFFGLASGSSWGFIQVLFYALLFFLITQHIQIERHIRWLLGSLVAGASLSVLYFWTQALDLFSFPGLLPAWNPVYAVNSRFGIILLIPLLIALHRLALAIPDRAAYARLRLSLWAGAAALMFVTSIALGFRMLLIISAIMLGLFLLSCFIRFSKVRPFMISVGFTAWLIVVLLAIFGAPTLLTVSTPVEVSLAHNISWQVALDTLKEGWGRGFLGSGPSTFGYDFSAHRPAVFNENFVWSARFNTAFSEGLQQLASAGALGIVSWILVWLAALGIFKVVAQRTDKEQGEARGIPYFFNVAGSAWILTLILFFFIPFGTVAWVYFFVFLALMAVYGELCGFVRPREFVRVYGTSPQWSLAVSFGALLAIIILAVLGLYLGIYYAADVAYARGLRVLSASQLDASIESFGKALRLNPRRYEYHIGSAQAAFRAALVESKASQPNQKKVEQLINAAVGAARRAAQISPASAVAWETLAGIYSNLRTLTPDATKWTIDTYGTAIALEPLNPALYLARGVIYREDGKIDEAKADFEKAIALKKNYAQPYLALSQIKEEEKDINSAIELARSAAQFGRGDLDLAFNLARLYFNRDQGEDLKNAEDILKAVLARNSDHANALFTLGSLYERQGKNMAALEQYRKVQQLDPDNSAVNKKISAIEGGGE